MIVCKWEQEKVGELEGGRMRECVSDREWEMVCKLKGQQCCKISAVEIFIEFYG